MKPFLRYVQARYEKNQRELTYRIFVTESLKLIPQNKYLNLNYGDVISNAPKDNRSGDEIASDVIAKIGLKFEKAGG